jgi:hypothetical protein
MNLLTAALLQVWQLPQNLVGLIFGWFLKGKERFPNIQDVPRNIRFISGDNMFGGISLGNFVYFRKPAYDRLLRHEAGHCRQSRILGPLYLYCRRSCPPLLLGTLVAPRPLSPLLLVLHRALGRPPGRGGQKTLK